MATRRANEIGLERDLKRTVNHNECVCATLCVAIVVINMIRVVTRAERHYETLQCALYYGQMHMCRPNFVN